MKITAKKVGKGLLSVGYHDVQIDNVEITNSNASDEHDDVTLQVAVTFRNDNGIITGWYNTKGFKKYDELTAAEKASGNFDTTSTGYAIKLTKNKAGKVIKRERIEDAERTEKCLDILGKLATNAGFAVGEDVEVEELKGKEVGIKIEMNNSGQPRVIYSFQHGKAAEYAAKDQSAVEEEDQF